MNLRWKKEPVLKGLAGVGAGPQASYLHDGTTRYARVYPSRVNHKTVGWYFVARHDPDVPLLNTCNDPVIDESTAKANAVAYVKKCLESARAK